MNVFLPKTPPRSSGRAFSIVELLVGTTVFVLLLAILLGVLSQMGSVWQKARNNTESFRAARFAFSIITRTLSQATLNTYNDYDNPNQPNTFVRKSGLHFVIAPAQGNDFGQGNSVFFQAKLGKSTNIQGLDGLLNAVGYYVTYGEDPNLPSLLKPFDRNRFRLMQYLEASEKLKVYETSGAAWFSSDLAANSEVVADNVILLLFWPRLAEQEDPEGTALTEDYRYDSRDGSGVIPQPITANQQPPMVQTTLVAIDEAAADRLPNSSTPPTAITSALEGLFTVSDRDSYTRDLQILENKLTQARIPYRVFSSMVPIRESKWTK